MPNARLIPAAPSRRSTVLVSLGLIALVGIGLVGSRWIASMRIPVVTIPNPVMPKPNAFDFYVAASNAVTSSKQINDAVGSSPTVGYTLTYKKALVQQNAGVFNTLHQGFAYPYLNPPTRSLGALFPYYAGFRNLTRVLAFQGQVRTAEGDWSGAADSYLDAMRLGQDIPHGSPLIGDLVGIACQAIGRKSMWKVVERLDASQSRSAITRLADIMDRHFAYADMLQEEKWSGQSNLLLIFGADQRYNSQIKAVNAATGSANPIKDLITSLPYLIHPKTQIMHGFTTYMDSISVQARQPYAAKLPLPPLPSDPINQMMLPVMTEGRIKDVDCQTQNGLLLLTLALHAFHVEHGHYPASLAELTPACLKKLPDDPFAAQGTFKYRVDGTSYVLYSVGPDGKDDGGTPINDPKKAADMNRNSRYYVEKNSVGDVVAGKNLW